MTNKQFLGEVSDLFFRLRDVVSPEVNDANRSVLYALHHKFTSNGASLADTYKLESPELVTEFTIAAIAMGAKQVQTYDD